MPYYKKKSMKTSKGYRLNPETHALVHRIQKLIKGDQDMAIGNACRNYYNSLKNEKEKPLNI
jgi:hypothetical protein